ncbi:hybrid sensor histidine kinase/response regulator [Natrarchaeobius chitinivorans]|uniref:Hybrid sensor histidine kinase/response regulator n=1 Tax=Natrarchaeobius chitinivorans TaxID=1679083 RepID=A0A3N6PAL4_NATCH|nr:hybrid sensor histidine kinase/response regulator [Natrarchaeobius chitinivorans]RQG93435.1 hybrid sensor histidine kinase/response regulator [Natrarchaeobius chitinivorans]
MDSTGGVDLLLVEDNPDDARFVERLLVEHRAESDASTGETALTIETIEHVGSLDGGLERIDTEPPDVVLLDLMLPDSGGLESVDAVVGHAPSVPVVVLTGRDDADVGARAIRRGAQDYLVKGTITAELLLRTLRYAIERARTQRELRDRNHRLALLNRLLRTGIRDDMSMIVGWGDQLHERVDDREAAVVDELLSAAEHALELTDTAADLVDVLSSDADLARGPVDLSSILDAEIAHLREDADVDVSIERYGPEERVLVSGSPMLGSVCRQLLTNATAHTERETVRITVEVETADDRVSLSITDDGVGVPDAQKRSLANSSRTTDDPIVGAGLFLVSTIVEELDGEFEIEDNYPRGTVVTVTLPTASAGRRT